MKLRKFPNVLVTDQALIDFFDTLWNKLLYTRILQLTSLTGHIMIKSINPWLSQI